MDTVTVCETCGSENVRSQCGNVGFCEDCDAPCTTVEVEEDEEDDHKVCPDCGEWVYGWRCSMCGYIFTDSLPF